MLILEYKTRVQFPEGYPRITTAVVLRDGRTVITGHESGLIVRSDLIAGKFEVLDDCHFEVTAISISNAGDIAVGCHSGLLYLFRLDNPQRKETVQQPGFSKRDRVWRLSWIDDSTFVASSTFGVWSMYKRAQSGSWNVTSLGGHSDSIFGLSANGKLLASGDWTGKILIWRANNSDIDLLDRLKILSGIQGLVWLSNEVFAAVDQVGSIHIFESEGNDQWRSVYETDTATSYGRTIHATSDGTTVYAGTDTELIQFDLDSQQMQQFSIDHVRGIFSDTSSVYVVSNSRIVSLIKKQVAIPAQVTRYQYSKICLIGVSGVGKTTLSSTFVKRSATGIDSTFGKRVWIKDIAAESGGPPRKLILHDHGGQEAVLGTYLPFLTDSDIILVFFQKNDYRTFEDAVEALEELEQIISKRTKIFLVQTFSDSKLADLNPTRIKSLIDSKRIIDCIPVDSRSVADVDALFARIMKEISWESEKTMIESPYADGILRTISQLYDSHATVVPLERVQENFKTLTGLHVLGTHLKFLLQKLNSQGIVEYYPDILDGIILNDDQYNKLRTEIPIFVRNQHGIVRADSILQDFTPKDYAAIIDQVFLAYKISVENDGLRLFPAKFKSGAVGIPSKFASLVKTAEPIQREYRQQSVNAERIIEALSDLKLGCIDASKTSGLFAWETNACIYYTYRNVSDAIAGDRLQFTFYVGGTKPNICNRLVGEFSAIIDRFFGPAIESGDSKKKFPKKYTYDLALTFAGEQRAWAEKVADLLRKEGLNVFYDGYMKSTLWGKNQPAFFQAVYYKESKWCMMFVSKDYVTKKWPSLEAENAIARQVDQFGNYILPVQFDESVIPGLPVTINHLRVPPETPESIASTFLKKFEEEP